MIEIAGVRGGMNWDLRDTVLVSKMFGIDLE